MSDEKPGASGKLPEDKPHGEVTGRTARYVEEQLDPLTRAVGAIKWIVGIAFVVASAGFGVAVYFGQFAKVTDLEATREELHEHERDEAGKLGSLDAAVRSLRDDHDWERRQIERIADTVGAPRVPAKPRP